MQGAEKIQKLTFLLFVSIIVFCLPSRPADGDENQTGGQTVVLEIPSSPNIVGSGARALGMGGAFIAVADDATAASWNPGGLIQLELPEISIVFSGFSRKEDKKFSEQQDLGEDHCVDDYTINYLSAAYPFAISGHNCVVSINYQQLLDFNREWRYQSFFPSGTGTRKYKQSGHLYALGLSCCFQICPSFSIGATLNRWDDFIYKNRWKQEYKMISDITVGQRDFREIRNQKETYDFKGWNVNLGFLWEINSAWRVGGVLKTPFRGDITYHAETNSIISRGTKIVDSTGFSRKDDLQLDIPLSWGIGLAWLPVDCLILSADIFRTHWDDFALVKNNSIKTSPFSGSPLGKDDPGTTTWFRLGCEYLLLKKGYAVPFRSGVFYDPYPRSRGNDAVYGITIGTGFATSRFAFDVAYQYRTGSGEDPGVPSDVEADQEIQEHKVYTSFIFYLN